MLLSVCAHAEDKEHLLLILDPGSDRRLLQLKDGLALALTDTTIILYTQEKQFRDYDMTRTEAGLSHAREAYEFLRFDESIGYLNKIVAELKNNADSDNVMDVLREAYLYLAMDYLALDKETDAAQAIDEYLCVAGQSSPDPVLYPPNLVSLVDRQKIKNAINISTITVTTTPSGAAVFIDGDRAGNSPVSVQEYAGAHFIRISRQAYRTKKAVFKVSNDTTAINFDLLPDPVAAEDMIFQKEQMIGMLNAYKADRIVMVSSDDTTQAHRITVSTVTARTLTPSSASFIYTGEKQAVGEIMRFIQPAAGAHASYKTLPLFTDADKEHTQQKNSSWYENKWLWTAGAALIAGGLVFAGLAEDRKSSSTTGSIAVRW